MGCNTCELKKEVWEKSLTRTGLGDINNKDCYCSPISDDYHGDRIPENKSEEPKLDLIPPEAIELPGQNLTGQVTDGGRCLTQPKAGVKEPKCSSCILDQGGQCHLKRPKYPDGCSEWTQEHGCVSCLYNRILTCNTDDGRVISTWACVIQASEGMLARNCDSWKHWVDAPDAPENVGGVKYDSGKLRLDLIPPEAIELLGEVYDYGARLHEPNSWARGIEEERLLAAALRHYVAYCKGAHRDKESNLPHLVSAAWNFLTIEIYRSRKARP